MTDISVTRTNDGQGIVMVMPLETAKALRTLVGNPYCGDDMCLAARTELGRLQDALFRQPMDLLPTLPMGLPG